MKLIILKSKLSILKLLIYPLVILRIANTLKYNLIDGKGTGPDGIPPEVFKYTNLDDIILEFANQMLIQSKKPAQLSKCDIVPIPKSGNLEEVGNYRGIIYREYKDIFVYIFLNHILLLN